MTADLQPVYLLRGDDPALINEAATKLIAEVVRNDDPAMAVEDINVELAGAQSAALILDACVTPPFLSARRIVVVRNAGGLVADDAARIVAYLDDPLATTALVLVAGGGTMSPKLATAAKKVGQVIDTAAPSGKARTTWLSGRLADAPVTFDAAAGARLADHLGEDMGRLPGLINSITAAYGEGARVGVDELEPFLGEAGSIAPWDLTDAIDKGDTPEALSHLHRLVTAGDRHPLVVLATLHRHYGSMLRLDGSGSRSDQEAADLLGIKSTFPARKAMAQARKLGSAGVRRAISLVGQADIDLRGGNAWPDALVLEVLVARLCRLAPAGRTASAARTARR